MLLGHQPSQALPQQLPTPHPYPQAGDVIIRTLGTQCKVSRSHTAPKRRAWGLNSCSRPLGCHCLCTDKLWVRGSGRNWVPAIAERKETCTETDFPRREGLNVQQVLPRVGPCAQGFPGIRLRPTHNLMSREVSVSLVL